MASAIVGCFPNKNGPFQFVRQSRQIDVIRSISACAELQTVNPGLWNRRFIGSEDRSAENPECISPEIDRHLARAAFSFGSICASGYNSLRYSAIAKVSQTVTSPWIKHGTKMDEVRISSSSFARGSSGETRSSTKSIPDKRAKRYPRSDHEE